MEREHSGAAQYGMAIGPHDVAPATTTHTARSQSHLDELLPNELSQAIKMAIANQASPATAKVHILLAKRRTADTPTFLIDGMIIEHPHAGPHRKAQLKHLNSLLGQPCANAKGFLNFSTATTANAVRSIKTLLSQTGRPPVVQLIDKRYQLHFASIKWKFNDIFDAVDFLSAYGRDNVFNLNRVAIISISELDIAKAGDDCCQQLHRESEFHCDSHDAGCLICAFDDASQTPDEHLPAPPDGSQTSSSSLVTATSSF
ncbi:hypothetical protein LTR12_001465 [Friedmanniomyces endolithicus]|nr:hypothetical protein LTR74_002910 [Friedmanniomyces endolithicus]KAK1824164.1 hypothetical protein LTR12_001465 [Friedmanniomyces endolithicus]